MGSPDIEAGQAVCKLEGQDYRERDPIYSRRLRAEDAQDEAPSPRLRPQSSGEPWCKDRKVLMLKGRRGKGLGLGQAIVGCRKL